LGWRDIFGVGGVSGLVCESGLPVPVSQVVIDRIRNIERNGTVIAHNEKLRTVIRINSGPFAEFHATMQARWISGATRWTRESACGSWSTYSAGRR
jgi:transcription antitermination factor NusG